MAEVFPFRAYRYNPAKLDLARGVTQPYDKITPGMQERYYSYGPNNLIAVEKGRSLPGDTSRDNVYTRAAKALERWIAEGILVQDAAPSIYVYSQEYHVPSTGERRVRKGFIALGRVEDYAARVVFPHEQTLAAPKADRLELLRHTRAQTGQLFMLYEDPGGRIDALLEQITRAPAPVEVRDEYDVLHRVWPVSDPVRVAAFQQEMADKTLVIADGHHRYETALAYRNECRAATGATDRDAPHEKAMMTFFNSRAEGLTILPTHRLIAGVAGFDYEQFCRRLEADFERTYYAFSGEEARAATLEAFRKELQGRAREGRAIGIYAKRGSFDLWTLRREANLAALIPDVSAAQRQLDVVLLHRLMLEKALGITPQAVRAETHVAYERDMDAALLAVDEGAAQFCCLLNSVSVDQVVRLALAGEVLPQKSTDFYPKLLSGLTIYRLDAKIEA